jgi:hypothetical protein
MKRLLTVTYGAASYLVGLAAFLHAIGFVGNIAVARSIDQGVAAPIAEAIVVNALLLGAFGVRHTLYEPAGPTPAQPAPTLDIASRPGNQPTRRDDTPATTPIKNALALDRNQRGCGVAENSC